MEKGGQSGVRFVGRRAKLVVHNREKDDLRTTAKVDGYPATFVFCRRFEGEEDTIAEEE